MAGLIRPRGTSAPQSVEQRSVAAAQRARDSANATTDDYRSMRTRVLIDKGQLDRCVEEQPQVFLEISERATDAVSVLDGHKMVIDRRKAELAREYRRTQAQAGEKHTDSMVTDYLLTHPEISRLNEQLAEFQKAVDNWENLKKSFEHRRSMLKELTALYVSGYWGDIGGAAKGQYRDAQAASARSLLAQARTERNKT